MKEMKEPKFCYRISAEAGLAHDGKGNDAACFSQVVLEGASPVDSEQYARLHERIKVMVSKQMGIPVEFFELISQEEYDANHEE